MRRFTRDVTHPAYAAMPELGRAQRIIFLAQWQLRARERTRPSVPCCPGSLLAAAELGTRCAFAVIFLVLAVTGFGKPE